MSTVWALSAHGDQQIHPGNGLDLVRLRGDDMTVAVETVGDIPLEMSG